MQDPVTNTQPMARPAGRSTGLAGTGRAALRLLKFAGITVGHTSAAAARLPFARDPVRLSVNAAHAWAAHLSRAFGIEAVVETPPPAPGALIVANHRSYLDLFATMSLMPITFTAKAELESWPIMGWAARTGGTIFVDRSSPESRDRTREIIRERLDEGLSMAVFPEGTTFEGPGLLEFRPGIFRLAAEGGFPVVPAAIWYEERENAWVGDDTFIGHFLRVFRKPVMRVHVAYGPPITGMDPEELRVQAWTWIQGALKN